jgi:hypothetical protein
MALAAIAPAAVGCSGIHLNELPAVRALRVSLPEESRLLPGGSSPLEIVATLPDGTEAVTKGVGHGKVSWDSFDVRSDIVSVNDKGIVSMPDDPRKSDVATPHVRVALKGHPDIAAEIDVPARYDGGFTASFSGAAGTSGISGFDGSDGADGASGSTADPDRPQCGGDGKDGSDGGDGGDGWAGDNAENVHVWIALKDGTKPLLQVRAEGRTFPQYVLIDPYGGSLLVAADGGAGGDPGPGGKGGRGGRGGSGSYGASSGRSGRNGRDGHDGHPGAYGDAGQITVSVDPKAMRYMNVVHFSNHDGTGRPGPRPEVREEPVGPLW